MRVLHSNPAYLFKSTGQVAKCKNSGTSWLVVLLLATNITLETWKTHLCVLSFLECIKDLGAHSRGSGHDGFSIVLDLSGLEIES